MTRSSGQRRSSVRPVSPADEGRQSGASLTSGLGIDGLRSPDERIRCAACGKEVRIVRLNKTTLTFGHTTNPGPAAHRVQLASAARNAVPAATGQPTVLNERRGAEAPDRRVDAPVATGPRQSSGRPPRSARSRELVASPSAGGAATRSSGGS